MKKTCFLYFITFFLALSLPLDMDFQIGQIFGSAIMTYGYFYLLGETLSLSDNNENKLHLWHWIKVITIPTGIVVFIRICHSLYSNDTNIAYVITLGAITLFAIISGPSLVESPIFQSKSLKKNIETDSN